MKVWCTWRRRGGHPRALAIMLPRTIDAALKRRTPVTREVASAASDPDAVACGVAAKGLPEHALFAGQLLDHLDRPALWWSRRWRRASATTLARRMRSLLALAWRLVERAVCAAWVGRARAAAIALRGSSGQGSSWGDRECQQRQLLVYTHGCTARVYDTRSHACVRTRRRAYLAAHGAYTYARARARATHPRSPVYTV